jgi:hypothetical protein
MQRELEGLTMWVTSSKSSSLWKASGSPEEMVPGPVSSAQGWGTEVTATIKESTHFNLKAEREGNQERSSFQVEIC